MKTTKYTVEVVESGNTLYYQNAVDGYHYVELDKSSSTDDFSVLGHWEINAQNDLNNGSITSRQNVEVELKASAVNVDGEINDALEEDALAKLTELDKQVLGL